MGVRKEPEAKAQKNSATAKDRGQSYPAQRDSDSLFFFRMYRDISTPKKATRKRHCTILRMIHQYSRTIPFQVNHAQLLVQVAVSQPMLETFLPARKFVDQYRRPGSYSANHCAAKRSEKGGCAEETGLKRDSGGSVSRGSRRYPRTSGSELFTFGSCVRFSCYCA